MTDSQESSMVERRLRLCDIARPHAERLRGMAALALEASDGKARSVDLQVAFITSIIADAIDAALNPKASQ